MLAEGADDAAVLLAHNHPSGNPEPSREDIAVTKPLKAAGEAAGVLLVQSVVCGYDGWYTSLVERGLLQSSSRDS